MQICDLDDYELHLSGSPARIIGGKIPRAISLGAASANGFGDITKTLTLSSNQISIMRYQVNSTGSANALSIVSPYQVPTLSGVLASGRATVSSLGIART
jgi:hypothetical protein